MKPKAILTVPEVQAAFDFFMIKNPVGGNLHLVLDNKNIEDEHIQFCIDQAKQKNDTDGYVLGNILLQLSKSQRIKIAKSIYTEKERPDSNRVINIFYRFSEFRLDEFKNIKENKPTNEELEKFNKLYIL